MKKFSLILCFVLAVSAALCFAVFAEINPPDDSAAPFTDVSADAWYYDSVADAYAMGIINGVSKTKYAPDESLTVAECIKLAVCVSQIQRNGAVTLTNGTENWYDPYVDYALKKGIITAPYADYNGKASRAQIAVMFSRVLSAKEIILNKGTRRYCDVTDETLWYYDSVYRLYQTGIMIGGDNGKFSPNDSISRSEIAAVVVRMLDRSKRVKGEISLMRQVTVPILMYHNFSETAGDYTITAQIFRSHLAALKDAGYTSITFAELIAYEEGINNLPEKPVLLTSDDGYSGVLDVALPVLTEYDMKLSIAVIGAYIGQSEEGRLPHFFLEEVTERDTEGRLELVSHSYGLHDAANGMNGAVNIGLEPDAYQEAVSADCAIMREIAGDTFPMMTQVFVYPFGSCSAESELLLRQEGYRATVTTDEGIAVVSPGEGLELLPRIPAEWYWTGAMLLKYMK